MTDMNFEKGKCAKINNVVFIEYEGKFFVTVGGTPYEVNEVIFRNYKRIEYGIRNNKQKHKHVLSLDAYENIDYLKPTRHPKCKSVEDMVIDGLSMQKVVNVVNKHKSGTAIIKGVLEGLKDTELGEELGISRQTLEYQKKKIFKIIREVLEDD